MDKFKVTGVSVVGVGAAMRIEDFTYTFSANDAGEAGSFARKLEFERWMRPIVTIHTSTLVGRRATSRPPQPETEESPQGEAPPGANSDQES